MQEFVSTFKKSGMSQKAYCTSKGLKLPTFNYWLRKLAAEDLEGQSEVIGFVELSVSSSCVFDVELPSGIVLRTREGVSFEQFHSCLSKLERSRA